MYFINFMACELNQFENENENEFTSFYKDA